MADEKTRVELAEESLELAIRQGWVAPAGDDEDRLLCLTDKGIKLAKLHNEYRGDNLLGNLKTLTWLTDRAWEYRHCIWPEKYGAPTVSVLERTK
jgi:hypothetical protein